jgi:hypothetical protein
MCVSVCVCVCGDELYQLLLSLMSAQLVLVTLEGCASGKPQGGSQYEELGVNGRLILKWILEEQLVSLWTGSSG